MGKPEAGTPKALSKHMEVIIYHFIRFYNYF